MLEFLGRDVCEFLVINLITKGKGYGIKVRNIAVGLKDWLEGRWNLFSKKSIPIHSGKKGMSLEFSCIVFGPKSMFWVTIKKLSSANKHIDAYPLDKRFALRRKSILGESNFSKCNIFVHLLRIVCIKR
jgi:hypothetical protein